MILSDPCLLLPNYIKVNFIFNRNNFSITIKKKKKDSILFWPFSSNTEVDSFVKEKAKIEPKIIFSLNEIDPSKVDTLVLVDVRKMSRVKHLHDLINRKEPKIRIIVYDHHPDSSDDVVVEVRMTNLYFGSS